MPGNPAHRRSIRLSGAVDNNGNISSDSAENDESATESLDNHAFPFLALLPELRNRVYSLVFSVDEYNSNLAALKFPSITRASRQLRQESLAFLFSERNFVLFVGSNIPERYARRTGKGNESTMLYESHVGNMKWASDQLPGKLGFKHVARRFLTTAGASAMFRDVTFDVYSPLCVANARYGSPDERFVRRCRFATLHLEIVNNRLVSSHSAGTLGSRMVGQPHGSVAIFEEVDIIAMVDKVVEIARDLSLRDGFKGFTTTDLASIAMGFRFKRLAEGKVER